jgi:hypothetical protein
MKFIKICNLIAFLLITCLFAKAQTNQREPELHWFNTKELCVEGKGWADTRNYYDRLPAKAKGLVREAVWGLSEDSPGICIRFVTDARSISARWTLRKKKLAMTNMPASGVSGLDLYVRFKGKWCWLGAARPDSVTNEKRLTTGMTNEMRECLLYLPLYNGIDQLEIGVPVGAKCELPSPRLTNTKQVVFYGTSIVQGGAASRPGMAYPAILCRRLDCTMINLGFSGNAVCEPEIAALLAELNPAVYMLDPLPNMSSEMVQERMPGFIRKIREAHPQTPIILVENTEMGDAPVNPSRRGGYSRSNEILHTIYKKNVRDGDKKLFYIRGDKLLGTDGQGTVDRVHPSDLGFMRMADTMEPVLKRALKAGR